MEKYYYSFWIRLLDLDPVNLIAWKLVGYSHKYMHSHPKLYRLWDRLYSDLSYLFSARIKLLSAEKMVRELCYEHHIREFDKLPDAMRHLAAYWRTVPQKDCKICK